MNLPFVTCLTTTLLFTAVTTVDSHTPNTNICPSGWVGFQWSCYKFSRSPRRSIITAAESCATYSAQLVSVNTYDEFMFISSYLREKDPQHLIWYTSGRDQGGNSWRWDGDRTLFINIPDLWLRNEPTFLHNQQPSIYPTSFNPAQPSSPFQTNFGQVQQQQQQYQQQFQQLPQLPLKYAAFNFSGPENRWGLIPHSGMEEDAFICEVPREDINHLLVNERNIDYGVTDITDPNKIPRGAKFTDEPKPAVFDLSGRSKQNYISLRCAADGYPTPTYQWFKEEYENARPIERLIDPLSDSRLTLTDGTLTIFNPQQTSDRGKYHCKAMNQVRCSLLFLRMFLIVLSLPVWHCHLRNSSTLFRIYRRV